MDHEILGEGNTIPLPRIKKNEKLGRNLGFNLNNWEMDQMYHMFMTFEEVKMEPRRWGLTALAYGNWGSLRWLPFFMVWRHLPRCYVSLR